MLHALIFFAIGVVFWMAGFFGLVWSFALNLPIPKVWLAACMTVAALNMTIFMMIGAFAAFGKRAPHNAG